MVKGTLIFAQSGGPTAVINASACGVFREAKNHPCVTAVLAARYGVEGVLNEDFFRADEIDEEETERLRFTPSSAFGSCRHRLPAPERDEREYRRLLEVFRKYNVRFFIYNGGNDSMDTCNKIAKYMRMHDYECSVIGVPKTVDNDLTCTDHCPGFGSAAKYVATTCHEIALDTASYANGRVTIVEIMGRDTGWLTASTALATLHGAGPDIIFLPETPFDLDEFAAKCRAVFEQKGRCLVAVSEGIRNGSGEYIGSLARNDQMDGFDHVQLSGVGNFLSAYLAETYGMRTRAIEISLLQRCAGHLTSKTDMDEAYAAGIKAVQAATAGETDKMVVFNRLSNDPYTVETDISDLDGIANAVRSVPEHFIDRENHFVTDAFIEYVKPLIVGENHVQFENGLPRYSNVIPALRNK